MDSDDKVGDAEESQWEPKDDPENEIIIKMSPGHEDDDLSPGHEGSDGEAEVDEAYECGWMQNNDGEENQDDSEPPHKKACFAFERDPTIRKRQCNKLFRRLKLILDEFSTRVGQQVAIIVAQPPTAAVQSIKTYGSNPLQSVISRYHPTIMNYLSEALSTYETRKAHDPSRYELPPLLVEGKSVSIEKMTQAQLREFIPIMLRYSTGRGKPGWGKDKMRPEWWPEDVPWSNVRVDSRDFTSKSIESWSSTLRRIIVACYKFHGREDLLAEALADEIPCLMGDDESERAAAYSAREGAGEQNDQEAHDESSLSLFIPKTSETRHVILTDAHGQEYCVEISVPNNTPTVVGNFQVAQQGDVALQGMTLANGQVGLSN